MEVRTWSANFNRLISHTSRGIRCLSITGKKHASGRPSTGSARSLRNYNQTRRLHQDAQVVKDIASSTLRTPTIKFQPHTLTTTVYDFPSMEPVRNQNFQSYQLGLPLRRDILHRAIIYEGDRTRQGTASTKWRLDVHGSGRKLRPQKGTGRARIGDKKSPVLRGGGVAFGPRPRDFSTKLPRKIYDLAWRTALSYRYRKGELLLVDSFKEIETAESWWLERIFEKNGWGNSAQRSMLVGMSWKGMPNLGAALTKIGQHGRGRTVEEVDVKNLLEMGRVIIEVKALENILEKRSKDIVPAEMGIAI